MHLSLEIKIMLLPHNIKWILDTNKKSRREYDKNIDVFQEHTWDIFIHGDPSRYNSREEALEAVKKDLKIDNKELNLIFESIDNVTAYT